MLLHPLGANSHQMILSYKTNLYQKETKGIYLGFTFLFGLLNYLAVSYL